MSQARDGGGRYARHLGIVAHIGTSLGSSIDLKGNALPPEVIAKKDLIVYDDDLNIDRQLKAGQRVPPELVDAYGRETGDTPDTPEPKAEKHSARARKDVSPAANK